MCGILAIFSNCRNDIFLGKINHAFAILESRGPDRGRVLSNDSEILAFRRLCINDISENGDQPMLDNNVSLMCNGEIFNHLQLQEEFALKCNSKSDCEVVLRLHHKIGFFETVKRLNGDYAIVISDKDNVYLARDRIGVRPLFLGVTAKGDLAVASVALALSGFCTGVRQLPPCAVKFNRATKQFNIQPYTFERIPLPLSSSIPERIRETLMSAVKIRLMSDRPIGCLLSGGLDSSLVSSILCKFLGPENVRTYSVGMTGSTDLHYARQVANYLGTHHTEVIFTPEEGIAVLPEVIKSLETYDITTIRASVGMYLISRFISQNSQDRVIFSGEGSDELLCGYLYFHYAPTPEDASRESLRLVKDLYLYDVLRADRTVSVHGLELRVPFMDRDFVNLALSIPGNVKAPQNGMEKHILREAFKDGFLPENVLYRRKEGFSDGVSGLKKSWYQYIQEHVEPLVSNAEFQDSGFPSKEAFWYKKMFDGFFPTYQPKIYYWMPKWINATDPSGRVTGKYDEKVSSSD